MAIPLPASPPARARRDRGPQTFPPIKYFNLIALLMIRLTFGTRGRSRFLLRVGPHTSRYLSIPVDGGRGGPSCDLITLSSGGMPVWRPGWGIFWCSLSLFVGDIVRLLRLDLSLWCIQAWLFLYASWLDNDISSNEPYIWDFFFFIYICRKNVRSGYSEFRWKVLNLNIAISEIRRMYGLLDV